MIEPPIDFETCPERKWLERKGVSGKMSMTAEKRHPDETLGAPYSHAAGNMHGGIVGGMFALPQAIAEGPPGPGPRFLEGEPLLLANARSGIVVLINHLRCRRIWVPSYLCPTIIRHVDPSQVSVMFYAVNGDLRIGSLDWIDELEEGDLVLFIDYFGFPADDTIAAQAKRKGCWVLEDACQALLTSSTLPSADFVLYSPRKFVGVPDGGILVSKSACDLHGVDLHPAPHLWWLCNLEASVRRREFDATGRQNHWFDWYLRATESVPIGAYRMSEVSQRLLSAAFDYGEVARRRIGNYRRLLADLADVALFKDLPVGVVPLGFPIRLRDRDTVRRAMYDRRIYPPVHWEIEGVVPEGHVESVHLSRHILTLPCDQRYGDLEMAEMIHVVERHHVTGESRSQDDGSRP